MNMIMINLPSHDHDDVNPQGPDNDVDHDHLGHPHHNHPPQGPAAPRASSQPSLK